MNLSKQSTRYVNLYFQVHQPRRLRKFQFSDIGSTGSFFDDKLNAAIIKRIAEDCYIPANRLLLQLMEKYAQVKCTFSISGSALDQLSEYAPQVITSFQELAATGSVEFLGETYFHSLSCLIDQNEFADQVNNHRKKIGDLFGLRPKIFRNTDLIYCDSLGRKISDMGFHGVYIDGIERVLNGRTSNKLYRHPDSDLIVFPRNYVLSDDIAFRYSERDWCQWPLTPEKFVSFLRGSTGGKFLGIGMGYETFGEHKKTPEGIFAFLEEVVSTIAKSSDLRLVTLEETAKLLHPQDIISTEEFVSWSDEEKDLSAWLGGDLQKIAFDALSGLYVQVKNAGSSKLLTEYRYLQASDHFYYMSTKANQDGEVHNSVNHYHSPYEAFRNYMNILGNFELHVRDHLKKRSEPGLNESKRHGFFTRTKESIIV